MHELAAVRAGGPVHEIAGHFLPSPAAILGTATAGTILQMEGPDAPGRQAKEGVVSASVSAPTTAAIAVEKFLAERKAQGIPVQA